MVALAVTVVVMVAATVAVAVATALVIAVIDVVRYGLAYIFIYFKFYQAVAFSNAFLFCMYSSITNVWIYFRIQ